jgi:hypothetical protein
MARYRTPEEPISKTGLALLCDVAYHHGKKRNPLNEAATIIDTHSFEDGSVGDIT